LFKLFNIAFSILNVDSEKLTEHVKEHKECYGLLNSQYSDNLHKDRFGEEVAEEMTQTGSKCLDSSAL
jgi:hypothetical protein